MCAEQRQQDAPDGLEARLRSSVSDRPVVTREEHEAVMTAVRKGGRLQGNRERSFTFLSAFETRLKIAAGLALCGLLTALFVSSRSAETLAEADALAPVAETLAVAEALPQYAQNAVRQLEAIPTGEWDRIQRDGQAAYGHVLRCLTQFGG